MTAAHRVVSSQLPRARWRDARARAALAVLLGGLAGAALGLCLGIRAPASEAMPAHGPSLAGVHEGSIAASSRPTQGSVAAALARASVAGTGTAELVDEARP